MLQGHSWLKRLGTSQTGFPFPFYSAQGNTVHPCPYCGSSPDAWVSSLNTEYVYWFLFQLTQCFLQHEVKGCVPCIQVHL